MAALVRFGEKAIEMGLATADQVEEALRQQEIARRGGNDRSLGAFLHDRGVLDLLQIESIMAALGYPAEKRRLIPDVEIIALIGRGATGAVYHGRSERLGVDVAVKVRAPRSGSSEDPYGNRFRAEAAIGKRLLHPNIVRLYEAGETRDFNYHMLEYVEGRPLDVLIKAEGRLAEPAVARIGMQIASALDYASRAGIVHRDVKPANVLVTPAGEAKLCDLGFAKDLNRKTFMTADGVLIGSPFYIAPEYARDGQLDGRSDIYSLGVTLYHAATGAVPFPGRTAMEILDKVIHLAPADPRTIVPSLSEPFAAAILRMIAKNPAERFQTPSEVVAVLARVAGRAVLPLAVQANPGSNGMQSARPGLWRRIVALFSGKTA